MTITVTDKFYIKQSEDTDVATIDFDDIVSDGTRLIFQWICFQVLGQLMVVFGAVTNVINIICFVKQGFKDSVNISLLCLSISDLCSLVTMLWTNVCYNPALAHLDLPFDPIDTQFLTGAWPHVTFTHVTSWITAFISLERCVCVTMPLKVKTCFTPKRVTAIMLGIYVFIISAASPLYSIARLGLKFSSSLNKTILGLIYADGREQIERTTYSLNNVLIPFAAFILVIVSTIILVVTLREKSKWRNTSLTAEQCQCMSSRDQKVTRMMTMISILFIVCFFPVSVFVMTMIAVPQLSVGGKYQNTLIVLGSVGFLLESTNSAVNIFIYYNMSSKYKETFSQVILCRAK